MIAYKMSTYKLHNETVLHFAAWKRHYSVYGATKGMASLLKEELKPYQVDKGTISLPLSDSVPAKLIERIVKSRAQEVAGRSRAGQIR